MNISVKIMSDVVVHTEKHKPSWFWPVVVAGAIVLAALLGAGIRYLTTDHNTRPETASGLPENIDNIQNLRLNNREAEASKQIEEALKTAKSTDDRYMLYMQQAHIQYDAGQWLKAVELYQKARSLQKTFEVTNRIAETYENAGNKAKAIEYYKMAIPLINPKNPTRTDTKNLIEDRIAVLEGKKVEENPVE